MTSLADLFHLNGTLGALVIAAMVTSALYGVTAIQTYVYFQRSGGDSAILKSTMGFIWILSTVHQVFICHAAYTYTVTEYGNLLALTAETWSGIGIILVTAVSDLIVRSIFCLRIWKFSDKKWFLVVVIMICSLGEFGTMMAFGIRAQTKLHGQFSELHSLNADFYVGLVCSVIADFSIAFSQVVLLWRSRSSIPRTNSIIRTLMLYSINTGALTGLCALLMLITWSSMPNNLAYGAIFSAIPTLLFNALLGTLNARQDLRERANMNGELISIPLSTVTSEPLSFPLSTSPSSSTVIAHGKPLHLGQEQPPNAPLHVSKEIKIDRMEDVV
ncbi:hypothetical protein OBBRIDRAFT_828595 [Obba rivulosa]|uniref:DUF6534 domain-containing protein n=1 Tax=Obba rivulosa TaxID=1052685 RepID=A0A8E2DFH5_9APHY|nr:hypothetical protein OBBRIDRAFT_828595 [Obba rivulosa]